jgi:hypothetical protein
VIAFCLGLSGIAAVVVSRPVQAVPSQENEQCSRKKTTRRWSA